MCVASTIVNDFGIEYAKYGITKCTDCVMSKEKEEKISEKQMKISKGEIRISKIGHGKKNEWYHFKCFEELR